MCEPRPRVYGGQVHQSEGQRAVLRAGAPRTINTSPWDVLGAAATWVAGLAVGLPASIAADGVLDKVQGRVAAVTNTDANGVRCYVAKPSDAGPSNRRPAVIVIHQETELCDDLARAGYVAVAPDTFQGQAALWPFRALYLGYQFAFQQGATWGVPDVQRVVQWLKSQAYVDSERVVVSGFCYGGGSAVRYCAQHPGQAAGCVIFYGRPLTEPEDVRRLGSTRVLGLYGTRDAQFPMPVLDKFKADLSAAGVRHELVLFDGEGHAFIKNLESTKGDGAAAKAWGLFTDFLRDVTAAA